MARRGRVLLVGAGPGDPELITVRGAKALGSADVVLYDELATEELLGIAPDRARLVNVGKRGHESPTRTQEDINALLVREASAGHLVVRLKGGDPLVFGRGGEEASACAEAGIPFEFVPGRDIGDRRTGLRGDSRDGPSTRGVFCRGDGPQGSDPRFERDSVARTRSSRRYPRDLDGYAHATRARCGNARGWSFC